MKQTVLLFSQILVLGFVKAQNTEQSVLSSSAYKNNQLSWTIGEQMTSSYNSENTIFSQDMQLDFYIITPTKINEKSIYKVDVYPNPFFSDFYIEAPNNKKPFNFKITSMSGSEIFKAENIEQHINVNMSNYSAATYFLIIYTNNEFIATLKIIKQ